MKPEAALERSILRDLGREPDVLLMKNEVGQGYYGTIRPQILRALAHHPEARRLVDEVLVRNRVTFGLGVGSPDIVAVVGGTFAGLELKSATGELRESQERWHAAARSRGVLVEQVRSVDEARAIVQRARAR